MSAPHLLLVDDSRAILAYESAVLGEHYSTTQAENGLEALRLAREIAPAAVLLDLSMPGKDGLEVLFEMKADPLLADVPVIIVSTERERAEACMRAGAAAFVDKPLRADVLRSEVARVLADVAREAERASVSVVCFAVARVEAALSLDAVHSVAWQPATVPIETGCPYLREAIALRGEPAIVLDLARRMGQEHAAALIDRKLVILDRLAASPVPVALCVDEVFSPEVVSRSSALEPESLRADPFGTSVTALLRTARGLVPLVDPASLFPSPFAAAVRQAVDMAFRRSARAAP